MASEVGGAGTTGASSASRKPASQSESRTASRAVVLVALVRRLGAEFVLDGHKGDVIAAAWEFAPDGFDVALVTAGGEVANQALATVRDGGRVAYPNGVMRRRHETEFYARQASILLGNNAFRSGNDHRNRNFIVGSTPIGEQRSIYGTRSINAPLLPNTHIRAFLGRPKRGWFVLEIVGGRFKTSQWGSN
jgi:threonine dehydrogenase-like Zn-dependent dehydrogenase